MDKLGIVGGLGPMATVSFLKRIITMTDAKCDQEHIHIVIEHCPSIPDRTGYILDHTKENPAPAMMEACRILEHAGVREIAIPCVTAHYFHQELSSLTTVPVMDGVTLCADYLAQKGIRRVGILATDGTVRSGILEQALTERGIKSLTPSSGHQADVMHLIYENVKSGRPVERERFDRVSDALFSLGAEVVILGCTELSVIADEYLPNGTFLDLLSVLARACVQDFGKLKEAYRELL